MSRIARDVEGQIFAKIEYFNPGFGKKDRIGLQIVEDAERDGRLQKGQKHSGSDTGFRIEIYVHGSL